MMFGYPKINGATWNGWVHIDRWVDRSVVTQGLCTGRLYTTDPLCKMWPSVLSVLDWRQVNAH